LRSCDVTDGGYNISDDSTYGFSGTGANGKMIGVSPSLGALAENGAPTETFAELSVGPSIDAIPFASRTYPSGSLNPSTTSSSLQLTCDQRGEPRPDHEDGPMEPCDIGGFELQETAPATATATAIATCTSSCSPTPTPGGYFR